MYIIKSTRVFLILFLVSIATCYSCDDINPNCGTITYMVKNNTDGLLRIELFPKEKYLYANGYYKYIDFWEGGIFDTTYEVDTIDWNLPIIVSTQIEAAPLELVNEVFDSIIVYVDQFDGIKVKFTSADVENYIWNLFTLEEQWVLNEVPFIGDDLNPQSDTDSIAEVYVFSINSSDIIVK